MLYLVVDLEATCDEGERWTDSETIEIGATCVQVHDSLSDVVDQFSSFVRPILNPILTDFCTSLTGIHQQDVDNASLFPMVFNRFCGWACQFDDWVFCSWGPFDKRQFRRDCKLHNVPWPKQLDKHLDLSKLFTKKFGRRVGHRQAMKILGVEPKGNHHRGIDDALNISMILPFIV